MVAGHKYVHIFWKWILKSWIVWSTTEFMKILRNTMFLSIFVFFFFTKCNQKLCKIKINCCNCFGLCNWKIILDKVSERICIAKNNFLSFRGIWSISEPGQKKSQWQKKFRSDQIFVTDKQFTGNCLSVTIFFTKMIVWSERTIFASIWTFRSYQKARKIFCQFEFFFERSQKVAKKCSN